LNATFNGGPANLARNNDPTVGMRLRF